MYKIVSNFQQKLNYKYLRYTYTHTLETILIMRISNYDILIRNAFESVPMICLRFNVNYGG